MTATAAPQTPTSLPTPLPLPLRSEAFAEDILEFVEPLPASLQQRTVHWLVNVAPLGVALLGVAFAVVPPLA